MRARITGAATSAGTRVYWVDRPQAAALPAVTLQIVSDPRPQHLKGFDSKFGTLVQIDCWGDSYGAVAALKEAVLAAVVPENTSNGIVFDRAMIETTRDLGERTETKFVHRASIDVTVWWRPA